MSVITEIQSKKQKETTCETKGRMLALGFFDCLHRGHRELIEKLLSICTLCNFEPYVFTFDDNFFNALGRSEKLVCLLEERLDLLEELGIPRKNVIVATPAETFVDISAEEFLDILDGYNFSAVIAGCDFRFGKRAAYGVEELDSWAKERGIICFKQPLKTEWNRKISSSDVRDYLAIGEVAAANALLGARYFICGTVTHGRGVGKVLGFPTINLETPPEKAVPFDGVYETRTIIEGTAYKSVTNVGGRPTFGENKKVIETHVIDFNGDLYGKKVKIEFVERLRSIFKFESEAALMEQIENDISRVKNSND